MGGIAGYLGLPSDGAGAAILRRIARQLCGDHRAPSQPAAITVHEQVGLIQLPAAGTDPAPPGPVRSRDGRYLVACHGTVYNHGQLRAELAGHGHRFRTGTAAEVLLASWRQWGAEGFDRCNGTFALAVLDTRAGELVLACDPLGVEPLYLAADGFGRVSFGSEPLAVLAAGVVPRRVDDTAVYRYLCLGVHDDTERSFFDRVTRLAAGESVTIDADGRVSRHRYSRLEHELSWLAASPRRYDLAAREELRAETQAAVRRRAGGATTAGTALTGGLAPATIAGIVDRMIRAGDPAVAGAGQQGFAVRPWRGGGDLTRQLALLSDHCGRRLAIDWSAPEPEQAVADLVDLVRSQQEPVASPATYLRYCLVRRASRSVPVLLDGLGAEVSLAAGAAYLPAALRALHRRRGPVPAALEIVSSVDQLSGLGWRQFTGRPRPPALSLLAADFVAVHTRQPRQRREGDLVDRVVAELFRHRLPALLRCHHRNHRRFGVQPRLPFLDPQLIRLLWSFEPSALIHRGWQQWALRDATGGLLPARLRWRRNGAGDAITELAGMVGPAAGGWPRPLMEFAREVFRSGTFAGRPYVHQPSIADAFDRSAGRGRGRSAAVFWRLLNLELWLRELIDRDPTRPPVETFVAHYTGELPRITAQPAAPGRPAGLASQQLVPDQTDHLGHLSKP